MEYRSLAAQISEVQLSSAEDTFIWKWTRDGSFSSKSAFELLHQGSCRFSGASRIWKSWAPPKVKFFIWLASRNHLWIADCWIDLPKPTRSPTGLMGLLSHAP
jgi:hypothetical protein